ncbi:MAG: dTDP-4-keto-6-deoxy-D-glucose epimerase [Brachymonas sp.]|nr:dTDP-4-keto-6-deoxy-D-glucose epimerase [Brachymonas sp.]
MSQLLKFRDTPLHGVKVMTRTVRQDERGGFARLFCAQELKEAGWSDQVAQINWSHTSKAGTVRGLHFQQSIAAEDKLVTCISGAVWDVAVDLRLQSPTYLQWHAETLSAENYQAMLLPKGVAHGFQSLESNSCLLYVHSYPYTPELESGLRADDPKLKIAWPLAFSEWSARDRQLPTLDS